MNFKKKWQEMSARQKKLVIYGSIASMIIALFFLVFFVLFYSQLRSIPHNVRAYDRKVSLEPEMIEKSLYAQTEKKLADTQKALKKLEKELEQLKKSQNKIKVTENSTSKDVTKSNKVSSNTTNEYVSPPPLPPSPEEIKRRMEFSYPPPPSVKKPEKTYIGAIGIIKGEIIQKSKKKHVSTEEEIYLPSGSFMKATLLTGVDAPTVMGGRAEPRPVLLRIKDLAILPNRIKSDLKGCFVTGAAEGKLNDERVHIVLERLSCIAKNGRAVIDQRVDGYVVDEDGKVGLKGFVAAPKLGSNIARSAIAGFFGGLGQAIQMSSMNTQITPTGTQQFLSSTDTKNLIRSGVGGGLSSAAEDVRKFYLQLAQQSMPVIEVGAAKTVTIVIKKGVTLKIKNYKTDWRNKDE